MRIAIVGTRGVPATYGGPETGAEQIARRLVERGHEVTVFCRRHHYRSDPAPPIWQGIRREMVGGIATKHLDTITHSLAAAARVSRRRFDAALVAIVGNLPVVALLRARRVPVVFNVDGTDSGRAKWGRVASAYLRLTERAAGYVADVLVTDADSLRSHFGSARDLRVIPYGSERTRRAPGRSSASWASSPGTT